jgi:hypothetical protein
LALASIASAMPSPLLAKPVLTKVVFCVPAANGAWSLARYKPLIDTRAKTTFAELTIADHNLLEFRLRRFSDGAEAAFDYKFDPQGKLNAMEGTVSVFGSWVGTANMLPDADGTTTPYEVKYSRNDKRVPRPEDAADYIAQLDHAPIYRTVNDAPCGEMLKEAEKMNATQE